MAKKEKTRVSPSAKKWERAGKRLQRKSAAQEFHDAEKRSALKIIGGKVEKTALKNMGSKAIVPYSKPFSPPKSLQPSSRALVPYSKPLSPPSSGPLAIYNDPYKLNNNLGRFVTASPVKTASPSASSPSTKAASRPLPCEGKPFGFGDACFADFLKTEVGRVFQEKQRLVAAGDTACGKDQLNAHQVAIFDAARALLTHGQEKMRQRGIVCFHATGSGKCFAAGTPILMYDGTVKPVETVEPGDIVMGDEGNSSRTVLALGRGTEDMYRIVPKDGGEPWSCNASHLLVLCKGNADTDTIMEVKDFLTLPKEEQETYRMRRSGPVTFEDVDDPPSFDPYQLGEWLGGKGESLLAALEKYGVMGRRRIPGEMMRGHVKIRAALLSGLVNAAATEYSDTHFVIPLCSVELAKDAQFLARSLGATASLSPSDDHILLVGRTMGNLDITYDFNIEAEGMGKYYGFTLDGNHRFLLGDFTVAHNTTTCLALIIAAKLAEKTNGKRFKIVLATTPSNRRGNSEAVYQANLTRFFPQYKYLFPGGKMGFSLQSYTVGSWYGQVPSSSNPMILIADECQNLLTPAKEVQAYGANLKRLRMWLEKPEVKKNSYFFGMSATPGDNIPNWMGILNLTAMPGVHYTPTTDPKVYGHLISYADPRGDKSMYGTLKHGRPINVTIPLDPRFYLFVLDSFTKKGLMKFTEGKEFQFLKGPMQKACVLSKTEAGKALADSPNWVKVSNRQLLVAPKVLKAAKNAVQIPGKQFVFAADPIVAKALEACLEQKGVPPARRITIKDIPKPLTLEQRAALRKQGKEPKLPASAFDAFYSRPPAPAFISFGTGVRPGGKQEAKHLEVFKQLMNDPRNKNGQYIKILVATQSYYTGLDLKGLRGVHIVQPLPTVADDLQAVGRALRGCGHSELEPAHRDAVVLRYFSTPPGNGSIKISDMLAVAKDMKKKISEQQIRTAFEKMKNAGAGKFLDPNSIVYSNAKRRHHLLGKFEESMKAVAYDCSHYKQGFHGDQSFQCGKPQWSSANAALAMKNMKSPQKNSKMSGSSRASAVASPSPVKSPSPFSYGAVSGRWQSSSMRSSQRSPGIGGQRSSMSGHKSGQRSGQRSVMKSPSPKHQSSILALRQKSGQSAVRSPFKQQSSMKSGVSGQSAIRSPFMSGAKSPSPFRQTPKSLRQSPRSSPSHFKIQTPQKRPWFDVLGVSPSASSPAVRKAYLQAARTHHPNKNPSSKSAAARFHSVHRAWNERRKLA